MAFIKNKESAAEPFKRAVTATMRAMAQEKELQVTYGNDAPGLTGDRARLPNPARDLPIEDVRLVRGIADSLALSKRYHDKSLHTRYAPEGGEARAVFDAIEQARVEAIGAARMKGVADNLFNRLDSHCRESGFAHVNDKADAPIAEVMGLLAREKIAGIPIPESAKAMAYMAFTLTPINNAESRFCATARMALPVRVQCSQARRPSRMTGARMTMTSEKMNRERAVNRSWPPQILRNKKPTPTIVPA